MSDTEKTELETLEPANDMPLIRMENVYKVFNGVNVLDNITLDIGCNEIVGLVGDNGAGKSTLIKVITGVHVPTSGKLYFMGKPIRRHNVSTSRKIGIETVYQERALADQQSIWRNIFCGREITDALGFMKIREQKLESARLMREHMGYTSSAITVNTEVKHLSGGEKQGIAISRALFFNAKLIILDEPTVALSLSECEKVQQFVMKIKEQGHSAIYISHSIYQLYPVCDRFIIMDRGRIAGIIEKSSISMEELEHSMLKLAATGKLD